MRKKNIAKAVAGVAAVAAIGIGAAAVSGVDTSSTAGSGGMGGPPGMTGMTGSEAGGGPPGEAVTGATAEQVEAAVTAKYPGTIAQVMEAPDGGYMTLVTKSDGTELMVRVSEDFKVLEAHEGGPGGASSGGAAPAGTVPDATAPPSAS